MSQPFTVGGYPNPNQPQMSVGDIQNQISTVIQIINLNFQLRQH